jgi:hypothetical protein
VEDNDMNITQENVIIIEKVVEKIIEVEFDITINKICLSKIYQIVTKKDYN